MPKPRVFVDTCIIIEAFRTNTWAALCQHFDVETVEKCVEECSTGDPLDPNRTLVPAARLRQDLAQCHPVTFDHLLGLRGVAGLPGIDDGELHLLAWLHAHRPIDASVLLSTADRAAVRAAHVLHLMHQVASLEALAKAAGVNKAKLSTFREQFCEAWMSDARVRIRMDVI